MILQQMVKKHEFQKNVEKTIIQKKGLDKHDLLFINQNNRELFKNFDELIQII